ncbi:hypothetical protein LJT71_004435 [Escherichia coli]|nr:hypothetical protein [Escherichia coli]
MKSKQNTLTIPGPMQISFDYTICIGDKEIKKGKHKEIIQKIRKEDVNEGLLLDILKERIDKILNSMKEEDISLLYCSKDKIQCKIDNYMHGFYNVDINVNS